MRLNILGLTVVVLMLLAGGAVGYGGTRKRKQCSVRTDKVTPLSDPAIAACTLEQARCAAGRDDSAAAALAAAIAARAYTSSRRAGEAGAALRDADRIAGRLTGRKAGRYLGRLLPQKLHVHCSRAWTQVGDTTTAREHQRPGSPCPRRRA